MTTTLLRGGPVWTPGADAGRPAATAVLIDDADGRVVWLGPADEVGTGAEVVVELAGRLVTPAFVDAHVHATAAGLALTALDLTSRVSLIQVLDDVAAWAGAHPGELILGTGWEETGWPELRRPTGAELDRAADGAPVYLARTDVHSAVASAAMLALAPEAAHLPGFEPDGYVRWEAHHAVRRTAYERLPVPRRRRAQQAVRVEALRLGVGMLHEMAGPEISGADDLADLLVDGPTHGGPGPRVVGYWGEHGQAGVDTARALGAVGAGGDLFVDGAIGSHTACLRRSYTDDPEQAGLLRFDADQVAEHLLACQAAGIQGGFHVIGDAALDAVLTGARAAARATSPAAVRAARHRLEHVEMTDPDAIATMAQLGLVASVQPLFDEAWGGPDGLYVQRLGADRAVGMNRFADLQAAGVPLVLSSDAPVTPVAPWRAVRAAVAHRTPGQGLTVAAALTAHTRAGWAVLGHPDGGTLAAGAPADLALWDFTGPRGDDGLPIFPAGSDDAGLPICEALWLAGRRQ